MVVLHTTEGDNQPGLSDLEGLGSWFNNASSGVSSHIGNDCEGNDARYVPDEKKAWTQAAYNSESLSLEQIGYARNTTHQWHQACGSQLWNTASWIAHWSIKYGIPIRKAYAHNGRVLRNGVAYHSWLGPAGGGHSDPGAGYPLRYVLLVARYRKMKRQGRTKGWRYKRTVRRINRIRRYYGKRSIR